MEKMADHLHEAKIQVNVPIPPALLTEPRVAIQIFLNDLLLTHVPALSGVVLSYSDLKLVDQLGQIVDGSPLIHVRVRAKILFYKLEYRQALSKLRSSLRFLSLSLSRLSDCVVTSLSPEFIGLNFLDVFQVSVLAHKISSYAWGSGAWTCKDTGTELRIGDSIPVAVDSLVTTEGHLTIHGILAASSDNNKIVSGPRKPKRKVSFMGRFLFFHRHQRVATEIYFQ